MAPNKLLLDMNEILICMTDFSTGFVTQRAFLLTKEVHFKNLTRIINIKCHTEGCCTTSWKLAGFCEEFSHILNKNYIRAHI